MLLGAAACSAAPVEPVAPAPAEVAEAPSPVAEAPRREPCRFPLEGVRTVTVTPASPDFAFEVTVREGRVTALLGQDWERLDAEVTGALEFGGAIPTADVGLGFSEPVEADVLRFPAEAALDAARLGDAGPEVVVVLGDGVAAIRVEARPVPVLCRQLAIREEPDPDREVLAVPMQGAELRVAVVDELPIRAEPGAGSTVRLRPRAGLLPLFAFEERDRWTRVGWRWTDGSELEGWVETSSLGAPTADERARVDCAFGAGHDCDFAIGEAFGYGGLGLRGTGAGGSVYEGRARIVQGATVYARPGGEPWATVRVEDGYRARWSRGSEWVELIEVPGMSMPSGSALVERSKVTLLDEPPASPR